MKYCLTHLSLIIYISEYFSTRVQCFQWSHTFSLTIQVYNTNNTSVQADISVISEIIVVYWNECFLLKDLNDNYLNFSYHSNNGEDKKSFCLNFRSHDSVNSLQSLVFSKTESFLSKMVDSNLKEKYEEYWKVLFCEISSCVDI